MQINSPFSAMIDISEFHQENSQLASAETSGTRRGTLNVHFSDDNRYLGLRGYARAGEVGSHLRYRSLSEFFSDKTDQVFETKRLRDKTDDTGVRFGELDRREVIRRHHDGKSIGMILPNSTREL
jgi:hypothetical protein